MSNLMRWATALSFVAIVAGCSAGSLASGPSDSAGPATSGRPAASASPSAPDFGAIEHATGTTDIVLRYEQGGGFVPPSFTVAQAPIFTLYGDGTVVFRNPSLEGPAPDGSVFRLNPLRTSRLSEDQIQGLLAYALGDGSLGIARAQYDFGGIADASTGTFTVDAGGIKKSVAVYALGMDAPDVPDAAARAAFGRLADRLGNFDQGGSIPTDRYMPAAYRAVLMDGTGMVGPSIRAWPWKDIAASDFKAPADPNAFQMATRTLTPDEVAALKVTDPEGGFSGMIVDGPDGKVYSLAVRPLLPDETE
jgi:hypothetical protein